MIIRLDITFSDSEYVTCRFLTTYLGADLYDSNLADNYTFYF